jgi:methionyl aminopeptidase
MEREAQRYAGLIVAETLQYMKEAIINGERNTLAINNLAEAYMLEKGVFPACKGYRPPFHPSSYNHGTCISINHEIVHGVPREDKILVNGDIVGLDVVGLFEGWHADAAITVSVGEISDSAVRLLEQTEKALYQGIENAKIGGTTGDIGYAVQTHARKHGLGIAKYLSGHGIGREIHCNPSVPNLGIPGKGDVLEAGMSICIEPMLTLGSDLTHLSEDTWAVVTSDNSISAHFEHTILIRNDGELEILTKLPV